MVRNQAIPVQGLWEVRGNPGPSLGSGKVSQSRCGWDTALQYKIGRHHVGKREEHPSRVFLCAKGKKCSTDYVYLCGHGLVGPAAQPEGRQWKATQGQGVEFAKATI